jgi:NADPH-dependent ferric siderophore reductase
MSLKEKATAFLMSRIGRTAHVITTQHITEHLLSVTLHLPVSIKWCSCQHLKFETTPGANYRDYTLAHWDEARKQATLLIDIGHEGSGSNWAQQLRPGQSLICAGPGGGFHQPTAATHLVCIGDASAIGHFTSLYHRKRNQQFLHALVTHYAQLPSDILGTPITTIPDHLTGIEQWLVHQDLPMAEVTFYVAGHVPLVIQTRKLLKRLGAQQIKPAGFWE